MCTLSAKKIKSPGCVGKLTCRRPTRMNAITKSWISQFAGLLLGNHLHRFVLHGFLHGCLHRFFRDVLHGFFARIFSTFCFCTEFLHAFFARFFARTLRTHSFWCPKPLSGKRQSFTEKTPKKFSMFWETCGRGL